MQKKILAVTMGDPNGVGGEVFLRSWQTLQNNGEDNIWLLLDDPSRVKSLIDFLAMNISIAVLHDPVAIKNFFIKKNNDLAILPLKKNIPFYLGQVKNKNDKYHAAEGTMESLDRAIDLVKKKIVHGMVTAPLDKSIMNSIVAGFRGHTDYLAEKDNKKNYAMMLLAEDDMVKSVFRTVPLTTHIPHRQVATSLDNAKLTDAIKLVSSELQKKFSIKKPRLAVAGINPHAGDNGIIGDEEINIMIPVIKKLQKDGIDVDGPLSADSLFTTSMRKKYDVFLCPSHDQALIPIKTLFFDRAVNVTLGLSYIRVSPDHGTGFSIADKKSANYQSMLSAMRLAKNLL